MTSPTMHGVRNVFSHHNFGLLRSFFDNSEVTGPLSITYDVNSFYSRRCLVTPHMFSFVVVVVVVVTVNCLV